MMTDDLELIDDTSSGGEGESAKSEEGGEGSRKPEDVPETEETNAAQADEQPSMGDRELTEEEETAQLYLESKIYTIKTTIGQEKNVADAISHRARDKGEIVSILSPMGLRGYIFVEGFDGRIIEMLISGIKHCRGLVKRKVVKDGKLVDEYGVTPLMEIEPFLTPKPLVTGINEGDIVELIAGPFKGEKGRVKHIDVAKEEITVELIEALVPIPVTVRGDHVRVLEREV
jgi:transcriptional antiterminator NusG